MAFTVSICTGCAFLVALCWLHCHADAIAKGLAQPLREPCDPLSWVHVFAESVMSVAELTGIRPESPLARRLHYASVICRMSGESRFTSMCNPSADVICHRSLFRRGSHRVLFLSFFSHGVTGVRRINVEFVEHPSPHLNIDLQLIPLAGWPGDICPVDVFLSQRGTPHAPTTNRSLQPTLICALEGRVSVAATAEDFAGYDISRAADSSGCIEIVATARAPEGAPSLWPSATATLGADLVRKVMGSSRGEFAGIIDVFFSALSDKRGTDWVDL